MKNTLLLVALLVSGNCISQNLKITLYNKTGYDIDSVVFSDSYVGLLKKDSSIVILNCNGFIIRKESKTPWGGISGIIRGKVAHPLFYCGTGKPTVTSGNYQFNISYKEDASGYTLSLEKHK